MVWHVWRSSLGAAVVAVAVVLGPARADFIPLPVVWSQPIGDHTSPGGGPDGIIDGVAHQDNGQFGAPVLADDFIADGRPIVAVRWWGSYLGGPLNTDGFIADFGIRFYPSTAADHPFSLPIDPPLAELLPLTAQQKLVGVDDGGDFVYRYDAYLPAPVDLVPATEYFVEIAQYQHFLGNWGWHDTVSPNFDYAAVHSFNQPEWATYFPESNLAFELMTVPEPGTLAVLGLGLLGFAGRRRG